MNNSKLEQIIKTIEKFLKNTLTNIKKSLDKFNKKYPKTTQVIQLTFIYFFAFIDLIYTVLSNVLAYGYYPEFLVPFSAIITEIFLSPILRIWASPEKVFFLSFLILELMVIRSVFNLNKLVRYNILLLFSLLMIQGLITSYWDLLFNREVINSVEQWAFGRGILIYTDKRLAISFFLNTFVVFFLTYIYLYIRALQGKFATIPGLEWLTDSVAFWLRIKTPTMRTGNIHKENDEEKNNNQ